MRVLFDTNVLLDALLAREPFVADASDLLTAVEKGTLKGFISATTITDIHYLVNRQTKNAGIAIAAITGLLNLMEICAVDRKILEQALALQLCDFEDAIQIACAMSLELDAITTRDTKGFLQTWMPILTPDELKQQIYGEE